jgi:hypothetical protein
MWDIDGDFEGPPQVHDVKKFVKWMDAGRVPSAPRIH